MFLRMGQSFTKRGDVLPARWGKAWIGKAWLGAAWLGMARVVLKESTRGGSCIETVDVSVPPTLQGVVGQTYETEREGKTLKKPLRKG